MKIINNRIMAQLMMGNNSNAATMTNDPNVGAGWNLFAFSSKLPTSKEGFDAAFNNKSLADMYNTSIGMIRSPIAGVESGNVLTLALQSQYIPKGVSYYGTIGSANTVAYQLMPHRITRSGFTDRSIGLIVGSGATLVPAARFSSDIDFEFDVAQTVTHVKFTGSISDAFTLVALSDDGLTEYSLGTATAIAGDALCLVLSAPRASKRYRYKFNKPTLTTAQRVLLSTVDVAPSAPATAPTWAVLAHCNTFTHGDTDYSDEIMYAAGAVGTQGPYKIIGDIIPSQKTVMYCPKLRFTQRSN